MRKLPFQRLVREVAMELMQDVRFREDALLALQEAAEMYLFQLFDDANRAALHTKRVTILPKNIHLVRAARKSVNADIGFTPI